MNWYKTIIGQTYQEVLDNEEYYRSMERDEPEYEGYFDGERYFSIGQGDDQEYESTCWIFDGRRMHQKVGGTHASNFPSLFSWNRETGSGVYRGWYDAEQKMISVVAPRSRGNVDPAPESSSLPTRLMVSLSDNFGTDNQVEVF